MGENITQHSFTAGEISPNLYARSDVGKYTIGLAMLKNGFVEAQGGASNRAGLEMVTEVKDSSKAVRVIPFSFNTEQTYIIEVGHEYFRFITDGGLITIDTDISDNTTPVEISTPYQEEDLFNLKYTQNADVLSLCHRSYAPAELSRESFYEWDLQTIVFEPQINAPTGGSATWTGGSATKQYKYVVTAIAEDTYEESDPSAEITQSGKAESDWTTSDYMTINWSSATGATEYNVYKSVNGIFGFIGAAKETSFVDDNIEPDFDSTAPIPKNPFSGEGNYPACVNYYQQRRVYANTTNKPQDIFATRTGAYKNFNISRPLIASDAIFIALAERQVNEIKNIVAMRDGIIALTTGGEWKINGPDGVFSASPPPIASPQSYYGSSDLMPLVSGNMILFTQAGRSVIRDLGYTYVSDSYDGNELTIFANHLFRGKQIIEWAYAHEPFRIVWAVMSDGTLNALTYDPKQEVLGWHRHETDGYFESVSVIREGYEDVPYFVVRREINGEEKRFIERMKSRIVLNAEDGFFVDCGLSYSGAPVTEITGLEYLEGKEVIILADGGVVTGKTVENGTVTLDNEASKIVVGLPYEFEFKTLNFEGENTQGELKIINKVNVKIDNSREDFFVVGADGTETQVERSIENINDSGLIFNKDIEVVPVSDYQTNAYVHIKQKYPLPLTILSVTPNITLGG